MAQFKTDLRDIHFNLFKLLKIKSDESETIEIISECNKFIEKEVYPLRTLGDHVGVIHEKDKSVKVPESFKSAKAAFYENGWYGIGYPENIGGIPTAHTVSLACQSILNGANVSFAMYPGLTRGAMDVILKVGAEQQKNFYVPKMMSGEWGGTMCLTEPGAGSDVGNAITTATPTSDGKYKIKGIKIFISSGDNDLYKNIIHLVLAKTPGAPAGTKGLSLFIVPKFRVDGSANDVVCTKIEEKMGIHAQATCEMTFGGNSDGCIGELIGREFDGMANMFIMMNEARLLCGVQGESQANLATMLTAQYAKERVQFGVEIEKHPDVRRMLLRMRSMSRGMRALILYTANLFDKLHHGDQSVNDEIQFLTPICKAYCSDEGFMVAVDAIQVHGGYGFCTEYGIEQFARDLKIATIYEGTNGIQAMDFTMRKVLKDEAKTFKKIGEKITETMKRANSFNDEIKFMAKNLEKAQEVLMQFFKWAEAKKNNRLLFHSTHFLSLSGNLVVAWLLLESAIEAEIELKKNPTGEEKEYLESKLTDFKFFVSEQLTKNIGLLTQILQFNDDLSQTVWK